MTTPQTFRLGISTHAFTQLSADRVPFATALREVREAGGSSTMLLHRPGGETWSAARRPSTTLFDVLGSDADVIAQACRELGLEPGVLRLTLNTSDENLPLFHRAAEVVTRLGWRTVMFKAPAVSAPMLAPRAKRPLLDSCAAFMSRVAAEHPKIRWCADVHWNSSLETVADAEHFCATVASPRVGICLNIGHMTSLHQPGWMLLERLPEFVHVIAWKDHIVGGRNGDPIVSVEAGTGDSPFERYMGVLRRAPIDAVHLYALESGDADSRAAICARSHRHLTSLWTQA